MITDLLAEYTRDLLTFNPSLIVIGRENAIKDNSVKNYIVIDELFSVPDSRSPSYDGDEEEQELTIVMKGDFTIDFHGEDARANAAKFQVLQGGQNSRELQRDLGITVFHASAFRDLKSLEGSQYKDRYQIEIKLQYNETQTVETLRIDTAQTTLIVSN